MAHLVVNDKGYPAEDVCRKMEYLKYLGVDGRKSIRIYLKEIGINIKNWVDTAQDRDNWRALENAALNLQIS